MPIFQVFSQALSGEELEQEIQGTSAEEVRHLLRSKGHQVLSVRLLPGDDLRFFKSRATRQLQAKELWTFCDQFAPMKEAGMPDAKAVEFFVQRAPGAYLRQTCQELLIALADSDFVSALIRIRKFPPLVEGCLQAAAQSAEIEKCLKMLAGFYQMQTELRASLFNQLIDPAISGGVILIIIIYNLLFAIPMQANFVRFVKAPALPFFDLVLGFDRALYFGWPLVLFSALAIFLFLRTPSPARTRLQEWLYSHFSPVGLIVYGLRHTAFCFCLGTLLKAGVPARKCFFYLIEVMKGTAWEAELRAASEYFANAGVISQALKAKTSVAEEVIYMLEVGEQSSQSSEQLLRAAEMYRKKTVLASDAFISRLKPLIIFVGFGTLIGLQLVTIFSTAAVMNSIQRAH